MARRLIRARSEPPVPVKMTKQQLVEAVDELVALGEEAKKIAVTIQAKQKALLEYMQTNKVAEIETDVAVAEMVTPKGNSHREIDPKKFQKAVEKDEDFWYAISVSVTKAEEVLSGKALEKITTVTPGELKDPVVKIKLKKPKKAAAE